MSNPIKRIHLRDEGQDLLWIDVQDGFIVDAGPFNGQWLVGQIFCNHWFGQKLRKGSFVKFSRDPQHGYIQLDYPIDRVEELPSEVPN